MSPGQGRFTSPDPFSILDLDDDNDRFTYLANPQNWNVYAYTLNNPLTLIDPAGAQPANPQGTNRSFYFRSGRYEVRIDFNANECSCLWAAGNLCRPDERRTAKWILFRCATHKDPEIPPI